jgi:MATE family multidrug resistance protein
LKLFVTLGLSSGIMSGLEAWAFETTGIMATSLSLVELDAHYVLLNTTLITYFSFPFGISIAASIRIGNLVGAGHIETAKLTAKIVALFGGGFMSISGIILASTHNVIGFIFSNDAEVVAQVARVAPIGGLFQLFDGIQGSLGGVLRGLGLQRAAALSNLLGLWVCGVTCAYLLTFPGGMGLPGLWWGLAIGLFITAICNCVCVWRTDWHKQVGEAQERIRDDEAEFAARRAEIIEEATRGKIINEYEATDGEMPAVQEL